jgi:hypothetical protein
MSIFAIYASIAITTAAMLQAKIMWADRADQVADDMVRYDAFLNGQDFLEQYQSNLNARVA